MANRAAPMALFNPSLAIAMPKHPGDPRTLSFIMDLHPDLHHQSYMQMSLLPYPAMPVQVQHASQKWWKEWPGILNIVISHQ
jgi:hypothetical protein